MENLKHKTLYSVLHYSTGFELTVNHKNEFFHFSTQKNYNLLRVERKNSGYDFYASSEILFLANDLMSAFPLCYTAEKDNGLGLGWGYEVYVIDWTPLPRTL